MPRAWTNMACAAAPGHSSCVEAVSSTRQAQMNERHWLLLLLALAALVAAGYAHLRLARFTAGPINRALSHVLLVFIGCAGGYIGMRMVAEAGLGWTAFLLGFGVAHVPAACILALKGLRGEGKS
jgi:hypothetical protein